MPTPIMQRTIQQVADDFQLVAVSYGVDPLGVLITMKPGLTFVVRDSEEHPLDEFGFKTAIMDAFDYDLAEVSRPYEAAPHEIYVACI